MANFKAHVSLVQSNQKLLNTLLVPAIHQHPDWVTTVAFYTALHMVEAMFFHDLGRKHTTDHTHRNETLNQVRYKAIFAAYDPLYRLCRVARYLQQGAAGSPVASFMAYMPPTKVQQHVLGPTGQLTVIQKETESIIREYVTDFNF